MTRKEYRFFVEGEVYHAPLGSIEQLLQGGFVREDLIVEADGQRQTLREALGKETSPPPRPETAPFRPFVVLGLLLALFFSSWILNDPDALRGLPGFGPVRRTCSNCHGGGMTNCTNCSGSGFEIWGGSRQRCLMCNYGKRFCYRCRGTGTITE
jgi:hypothetical protein